VFAEFDDVWALSDFAASSLSTVLRREVPSVPCVVDLSEFPQATKKENAGLDPREFVYLFVFDASSSTERKNPEAVVRAFQMAFRGDDPVRLVIKASNGNRLEHRARVQRLLDVIGGDPRIEVRRDPLTRAETLGLISASDCYVSLHRSEGFGYTCAEAMGYAKPVIATGYSGNLQFMNEENSYLVEYDEIESTVAEGPFQRGSLWAEPRVESAARWMRHVFESRDEAAVRGRLARATVATQLSPEAVAVRVSALLR
jgi:glycosyltransferase involved in cell wall biosynthesis